MNEALISQAASTIAKRRAALAWLKEYGSHMVADNGAATIVVHLNHASACHGAKEAAEVLSAYGRFSLPTITKASIECCRNDIDIAVGVIQRELEKYEGALSI